MKKLLSLSIILFLFSNLATGQAEPEFFLDDNGVTIKCINCSPGDKGVVNDVEYEAVDNERLIRKKQEGVDLGILCTTLVTDMNQLFYGQSEENWDISSWDVSNVTDMSYMFYECTGFIQDISSWDVSSVVNMSWMFYSVANEFSSDIGLWDVSSVTEMSYMFHSTSFNQDISSWDVSNVIEMSGMFNGAALFNQPIGSWDMSSVSNMSEMFYGAISFNQDISSWDVSNVTDMSIMFASAWVFNQDIGSWDVSNVINMAAMFSNASKYNQDISLWDVSNVTDMSSMFVHASKYNQDISLWDVSNVTDMSNMFVGAGEYNRDISSWDVSNVTDMSRMFREAAIFNQDIGSWNVSNVMDMSSMFDLAISFDQDLSNWCVENIPEQPQYFAYDSPLATENYPKWGEPCLDFTSPIISFEKDTIDLTYESSIKIVSNEKGYAFLVPEYTTNGLDEIRENIVQDSIELDADVWTDLLMENLETGVFWLYARDNSFNVSEPDTLVIKKSTSTDNIYDFTFKIYPNPLQEVIYLSISLNRTYEIKVISSAGQLVWSEIFTGREHQLNMSGFQNGIYFVTVKSDAWVRTEKVVKY